MVTIFTITTTEEKVPKTVLLDKVNMIFKSSEHHKRNSVHLHCVGLAAETTKVDVWKPVRIKTQLNRLNENYTARKLQIAVTISYNIYKVDFPSQDHIVSETKQEQESVAAGQ